MDITQFTNWQTLLSYGGASVATAVLTQIFKGLFDKLPIRVPTRLFSYIISLLLLLSATFFAGKREIGDYALCAVNAALVSLSANGTFDMMKSAQKDTVNTDIFDTEDEG